MVLVEKEAVTAYRLEFPSHEWESSVLYTQYLVLKRSPEMIVLDLSLAIGCLSCEPTLL